MVQYKCKTCRYNLNSYCLLKGKMVSVNGLCEKYEYYEYWDKK